MELSLLVVGIPVLVGVSVAAIEITRREGKIALPFFLIGVVMFFALFHSLANHSGKTEAKSHNIQKIIDQVEFSYYMFPSFYHNIQNGHVGQVSGPDGSTIYSYVAGGRGYTGVLLPFPIGSHMTKSDADILKKISVTEIPVSKKQQYNAFMMKNGKFIPTIAVAPNSTTIVSKLPVYAVMNFTPRGVVLTNTSK